MKNKILKSVSVVAIVIMAGINMLKAQQPVQLSDIAMANVEALADNEVIDREDCEPSIDECSMLVIYSDGDYGYDIVLGMTKKPGLL